MTEIERVSAELGDEVTLAPAKLNWDLRRDVEPKLAILQKRTQRAIVDAVRDRISAGAGVGEG